MGTYRVAAACALGLVVAACGSSQGQPKDGGDAAEEGDEAAPEMDIPITPQKPAPPDLSADEKKELSATCNPIEPLLYDAGKQARVTMTAALESGASDADAEKKGLAAGLKLLEKPQEGLGAVDQKRCVAIFTKQTKRKLFDFEPAEESARFTLKTCVERASAAFGKQSLTYDEGAGSSAGASHGPFCPDDFPVPPSLNDLPYKSKGEDWNTPAWKCLSFGLRIEQPFQIEYAAPIGKNEFYCIARFLPRQGGAPIELIRGGKMNKEGELLVGEKVKRRRMKK